jgi:hypothetical protein
MSIFLLIAIVALVIILGIYFMSISCRQIQVNRMNRVGFVQVPAFFNCSDVLFNDEITAYPAQAEVAVFNGSTDRLSLGLSVDPWRMSFGTVPQGDNYVTRKIDLSNLRNSSMGLRIEAFGNISKHVIFNPSHISLGPWQNATIEARFYAKNATVGNYSGEIDVFAEKPLFAFPSK